VNKEPKPLGEIRPDLPTELCALVHKMMMKRPEARYQTGREIVRDVGRLRDAFAGNGGNSSLVMLSGLTSTGMMPSAAPTDDMGTYAAALSVSGGGWPGGRHPWLFVGMIV